MLLKFKEPATIYTGWSGNKRRNPMKLKMATQIYKHWLVVQGYEVKPKIELNSTYNIVIKLSLVQMQIYKSGEFYLTGASIFSSGCLLANLRT